MTAQIRSQWEKKMSWLGRLLGKEAEAHPMAELYAAIVQEARDPAWYTEGAVHDTIDGRFEMLALILSLVFIRLDIDDPVIRQHTVELTERFVDDMDGQVRQIGFGDLVVGKQVGKMMGALGGRIGAYREHPGEEGALEHALHRNLYRGESPPPEALEWTMARVRSLAAGLAALPVEAVLSGKLRP